MDIVKVTDKLLKALEQEDRFTVEHITSKELSDGFIVSMTIDVHREKDFEYLRDEIHDIEFAIPRVLVAKARCASSMQMETPVEANLLILNFLLQDDA